MTDNNIEIIDISKFEIIYNTEHNAIGHICRCGTVNIWPDIIKENYYNEIGYKCFGCKFEVKILNGEIQWITSKKGYRLNSIDEADEIYKLYSKGETLFDKSFIIKKQYIAICELKNKIKELTA